MPTRDTNVYSCRGAVEFQASASNQYRPNFTTTPTGTPPPNAVVADSTIRAVEILESIKNSADSSWLPNNPTQQEEKENRRGATFLNSTPQHLKEYKHYLPEFQFGATDKNPQYLRGDHRSETSTSNIDPEREEREQGAMDWQNTPNSPLASSSPHSPRLFPTVITTKADLPVVPYVVPLEKDMSIILNGRHTPARADPGTNPNIIDARYAKEIGATINFGAVCSPIPLPTFERQLQPIGIASVKCEFRGAAERVEDFIVVENFVYQVVLGRTFLQENGLGRNWFERRLYTRDVPIVPYLSGGKEKVKCRLDGKEVTAMSDSGAAVNVMSLNFATKMAFDTEDITAEDDGQIRFADSSVQDIQGLVSVAVSFGSELSPAQLSGFDGLASTAGLRRLGGEDHATELDQIGGAFSIIADFYVLEGLNVDVVLGEDLLSTAGEFVVLSAEVIGNHGASGPVMDGSRSLESIERSRCSVSKEAWKHNLSSGKSVSQRDMKEMARYERERERIQNLLRREKRRAERRNEKKRHEYNRKRAEGGVHPGSDTLHYRLCPCKLHSLAKSN